MDLVEFERRLVGDELADGVEGCIDRAVAGRLHGFGNAVDVHRERGGLGTHGARDHLQSGDRHAVAGVGQAFVDQGFDILVVDVLLAVGQCFEAGERVFECVFAGLIAQILELGAEGGAARMLAHDK